MQTIKQKVFKKEWESPKIKKIDIRISTKAKHGTGPETAKPNGGCFTNSGSYCP